nr:histamine H4 receptor isoform X1 [Cavia porcellus]
MLANNSTIALTSIKISLTFLMSLLAIAIMLGNVVVILAFIVDRNLRHRSNYFFLNLAIADFFVVSDSWQNSTTECEPGFLKKWYFALPTSLLEFLIPILLVAYFSAHIYWSLWKREKLSRCLSHPVLPSDSSSSDHGHSCRQDPDSRATLPARKETTASLGSDKSRRKSSLLFSIRAYKNSNVIASKMGFLSHSDSLALQQREHIELFRARKLAKSLAILLAAFAICWAPYSLTTVIYSFFPERNLTKSTWYHTAFWLQWFNSFVNPFLYPLCHKRFQKAFLKILPVRRQSTPPHNRSIST